MKFWKIFGATLLASVLVSVISGLVYVGLFSGFLGLFNLDMFKSDAPVITPQTIVKIDFAESITDAPSKAVLGEFDFSSKTFVQKTHLLKVLKGIEAAKFDPNVKGLYLNFTGMGSVSSGVLEELRRAIIDFKQSGKFVVAYNESYSQGSYYLASAADKVYLHPEGHFSWTGLANSTLFLKGAFDKLGLKVEAFRPTACKYKSAVEPYIRKNMSPENRAQMQMLADDMWNVLAKTISTSRNIDVEVLKKLANNLDISLPEEALKHNLVDALIYEDEMEAKFAEYGVTPSVGNNDYNIISLSHYISLNPEVIDYNSPALGVVYAEGEIFDGEGDDDNVYSANLVKLLQKARKDNNIKAVVLRVNSPGGSALASDVIWREVELLRKEKPLIVSMGSYAASGGYYISTGADAIIADELTITGSIGVFGLLVEGQNMFNEKLGITSDVVKTNPSADFGENILGIGTRKITETERKAMIRSVDKVYDTFVARVSNGRNLPKDKVLDIAQGRVWSGSRAVGLGLADANGGLREAISLAINSAGISDNYSIIEILEELPPVVQFIKDMSSQVKAPTIKPEISEVSKLYNLIKRELTRESVQAYCPYTFSIN